MMRELLLVGLLALAFGVGAHRGTGEWGIFGFANLAVGGIALLGSAVLFARSATRRRSGAPRGVVLEPALRVFAIAWAAVLVQQAAAISNWHLDWTFERRYQLAPATIEAIRSLPERVYMTLYVDPEDPRHRRTRLLLDRMAESGNLVVRMRNLGDAPEEEDFFAVRASNTVVLEMGDRWERVDRPTEGALFEALSYLGVRRQHILYATAGGGEGDFLETSDTGFSGLGAALENEGIVVRRVPPAALVEIPDDADGVIVVAPQRPLHPVTLEALRSYLARGGHLIALLEPDHDSGIEALLADYGIIASEGVVVDPASGVTRGGKPGLDPVVTNYSSDEAVTRGLNQNRGTYFRGARAFTLHKARPGDRLRALVFASGESWVYADASVAETGRVPDRPPGTTTDYHPLVVSGIYARDGGQTRIVAFGDSTFADNANLRTLYNLDLVMNAVHWALREEPKITLRPKAGGLIQFPIPIQNSLKAFYGVGLLVPELLLMGAGIVWLRRRTA